MAAGAPRGDFKLVLDSVNRAQLPAIVAELMDVLNIDRKTANGAVENTPIVLVGGMSQQQAANLRTHVLRLGKLGASLRFTADPVGKMKQLRWQALPPVVRRPANIFVCPACGERFIVQRWQPAPAAQPARAPARPAAAAPAAPQAPPAPPPPAAAPAPPPAPPPLTAPPAPRASAPPAPPEEREIPEAQLLEAEPLEAEAIEEASPAEELEAAEAVELPEAAEVEEAEEIPEAAPLPAEPEPAQEPGPAQVATAEAVGPAPKQTPKARPARAPKPAPAAKPVAQAPAGPRYDVSVAKVRGPKQDRLAELVAARQGITYDEAMRLCERTVVVVCKDATSAQADEWRKALLKLGIKPRIRKRSG